MRKFFKNLNEKIAIKTTLFMSSMACVWLFLFWSILPVIYAPSQNFVFYVSSAVIQLVALPIIMVGNNLLNKSSEDRAKKDHKLLMQEIKELKEIEKKLDLLLAEKKKS